MAQSPKVINNIKHEAAFAAKHAAIRAPSARGLSDEAAEAAAKGMAKSSAKNIVERGSKVKSWLKGLKFGGGIGAMDNPLLSKESMDDILDNPIDPPAIRKARVRPSRKGNTSA
jgi:hypothetical protein